MPNQQLHPHDYPLTLRILDCLLRYRPDAEDVGHNRTWSGADVDWETLKARLSTTEGATISIARGIAIFERLGTGPNASVHHAVMTALRDLWS